MENNERRKEYWIFENEPGAEISVFFAGTKRSALEQYNEKYHKNYKLVSEHKAMGRMHIFVVEKNAWLHYDFRKFSYAVMD